MKKLILFSVLLGTILFAQAPFRLVDSSGNSVKNGASGVSGLDYDSGQTTILNTATTITSTKTWVQTLRCNTINATASTITITDGSNVVYANAVALAANGVYMEQFNAPGLAFTGGVKITAGTSSALLCQVHGVQ